MKVYVVIKIYSNWEDPEANATDIVGVCHEIEKAIEVLTEDFIKEKQWFKDEKVKITSKQSKNKQEYSIDSVRGDVYSYILEQEVIK